MGWSGCGLLEHGFDLWQTAIEGSGKDSWCVGLLADGVFDST